MKVVKSEWNCSQRQETHLYHDLFILCGDYLHIVRQHLVGRLRFAVWCKTIVEAVLIPYQFEPHPCTSLRYSSHLGSQCPCPWIPRDTRTHTSRACWCTQHTGHNCSPRCTRRYLATQGTALQPRNMSQGLSNHRLPHCLFDTLFMQASVLPALCEMHWWPVDSRHKGAVMQKGCQCHEVIIHNISHACDEDIVLLSLDYSVGD